MARSRYARAGVRLVVLSLLTVLCSPLAVRAQDIDELRRAAQQYEKNGEYGKACSYYAAILAKDRSLTDVKERFHLCLRHFHRTRRHQDETYRKHVLTQEVQVALKVYSELVGKIHWEYHEASRVNMPQLFRQGLDEMKLSLADARFRQLYLPHTSAEAVARFVRRLDHDWNDSVSKDAHNAIELEQPVLQVAMAARTELGINPTVTILELACGACNAVDEHTCYVPPTQHKQDVGALRGETAGVGIELGSMGEELIVTEVVINSPAARAGVVVGDRLVRVDRLPVQNLTLEAIQAKLVGKPGTAVELDIATGMAPPRTFNLVRLPIQTSVTDYRILDIDAGVGYIKLTSFHENTLNEVDDAISQLEMQGMKVLVLDLRGNYGGLLEAAAQVAERFLWEGVTIYGKKGRRDRPTKMTSHNVRPATMPLVVLVDGSTASAAEILAGALKDNSRATLIGENTFGKGTVQHMLAIKIVQASSKGSGEGTVEVVHKNSNYGPVEAGSLHLSWAKLYSPNNHCYNKSGVSPHVFVERNSFSDEQRNEARLIARQIAGMAR